MGDKAVVRHDITALERNLFIISSPVLAGKSNHEIVVERVAGIEQAAMLDDVSARQANPARLDAVLGCSQQ